MAECYYSYSFDLDDGIIRDELFDKNSGMSPMKAVGLSAPIEFDDYIDIWVELCHPVFYGDGEAAKLSCSYLKAAYDRGEREFFVDIEHNPLKTTYATKYTRINIKLYDDADTKKARALVLWESNPELETSNL